MAGAKLIKPDLQFVKRIVAAGGDTAKKCYQCDTCNVVCNLSPDERPFPRKEMLQAQWGLKDVLKSPDIWLCHQCSDCTVHCPRGAKPGEVMGVLRQMCIENYAIPPILGCLVGDIRFLPLLIAFPVMLFLAVLYGLGMLGVPVGHGMVHQGIAIPEGKIIFSKLFPTLLGVDLIFVPALAFGAGVLALGVMKFWKDLNEANPWKVRLQGNVIGNLVEVVKDILLHNRFKSCDATFDRALNHLLLVFGFIFLAIVTAWGFLREWVIHFESPYTLIWPPDPISGSPSWVRPCCSPGSTGSTRPGRTTPRRPATAPTSTGSSSTSSPRWVSPGSCPGPSGCWVRPPWPTPPTSCTW